MCCALLKAQQDGQIQAVLQHSISFLALVAAAVEFRGEWPRHPISPSQLTGIPGENKMENVLVAQQQLG
jgi:hypothetical protein